jgi:hypothetical protein
VLHIHSLDINKIVFKQDKIRETRYQRHVQVV